MKNYLIIGNGPAGTFAAKEIRAIDNDASIKIISEEPIPFYSRPRLPEVIYEKSSVKQIQILPDKWYETNNIELILNTKITKIDTNKQEIYSENKIFKFDKLLIASGSISNKIPIPGSDGKNIYVLRTAADAEKLNNLGKKFKKAAVIGGGLLGLEAANALVKLGIDVTVIEFFNRLLPRQLDEEGAKVLQNSLEKMGFKFFLGAATEDISDLDNNKKLIKIKDGRKLECDFIVFSTGIKVITDFIKSAGIECNKGLLVNENLQTNIENIFAAGDIVEFNGRLMGLWPAAKEQGEIAGKNMTGQKNIYVLTIPATNLKVAGIALTSIGEIEPNDNTEMHTIKYEKKGIYKKIFIENNIVKGSILIGDNKLAIPIKKAIGKEFNIIEEKWLA